MDIERAEPSDTIQFNEFGTLTVVVPEVQVLGVMSTDVKEPRSATLDAVKPEHVWATTLHAPKYNPSKAQLKNEDGILRYIFTNESQREVVLSWICVKGSAQTAKDYNLFA